jgi:hypothetical protein
MGALVFARELFISARLFERVEIGALNILDDGELDCLCIGRLK